MKKLSLALALLFIFAACKKDTHQAPPAQGTLSSSNEYGSCSSYPVHGLFYNGVPATADTNYVEVGVKVTKAGSYKISTDKQRGVTFSAQGVFADTGFQSVRLRSSGVFDSALFADFKVSFDSSFCTFRVWIQDSAGLSLADNSWQFTANGHAYKGFGSAIEHQLPTDIRENMTFYGSLESRTDTSFVLYLQDEVGPFNTALDYPTSKSNASFSFATPTSYPGGAIKYDANTNTIPAVLNIHPQSQTIAFYEGGPTREVIIIRFSGTAKDGAGNIVPITNGVYKAVNPRYVYP